MYLVRLIYVSEFKVENSGELQKIVETSKANNKKVNITGVLCADGKYYLQCLEGPRDMVNSLYIKIAADERHKNITLLEYKETPERAFSDWHMNMIVFNSSTDKIIFKYSTDSSFNPYNFSGESAFRFLKDISDQK